MWCVRWIQRHKLLTVGIFGYILGLDHYFSYIILFQQEEYDIFSNYFCRCGKLFKSNLEVEFHATKSGHDRFSESTEEKKPLTEEEKREQLKMLEEKLRQKRKEREEQEKKDALEREKNRIRSGKEMSEARKK